VLHPEIQDGVKLANNFHSNWLICKKFCQLMLEDESALVSDLQVHSTCFSNHQTVSSQLELAHYQPGNCTEWHITPYQGKLLTCKLCGEINWIKEQ
jgi:hypothetical protein